MDSLLSLDQQIFLLINHLPRSFITYGLALLLSGAGTAGIVWFILGFILFLREERKHHWFFAPIIMAGGVSWFLVEKVIKVLVGRVRPSLELGAIIAGGGNGKNDFSFPSGHATIAFAMAVVLSKIEPKWKLLFYILAVAISFSRIYIGKHYPLDVIGGAVLGWLIGKSALWLSKWHIMKA